MGSFFALALELAKWFIPRAIKAEKDREYVKRLIDEALKYYDHTSLDPASVRQSAKDLDAELERRWQERFGNGGGQPPVTP